MRKRWWQGGEEKMVAGCEGKMVAGVVRERLRGKKERGGGRGMEMHQAHISAFSLWVHRAQHPRWRAQQWRI